MFAMDHRTLCDLLDAELAALDRCIGGADLAAEVPTCPGWTVRQLLKHLGIVHRWTTAMVAVTSAQPMPSPDLAEDQPADPGSPAAWAEWISVGGSKLLDALRAAEGDAPMWAWGADQHVRFWSRRQLHETTIHRVDLEIATGHASWAIEPRVAVDGIDEFLVNLAHVVRSNPDVAKLRGEGSLHFHATDVEGEWMVELSSEGFVVSHGHGKGSVAARGTAADLLAVLYRRAGSERLELFGDTDLFATWLTNSAM